MIYDAAEADDKKVVLDSTSTEAMIAPLMLREFKEKDDDGRIDLKLKEHRPSFTSEVTLAIDDGLDLSKKDDQERKLKKPFTVKKLEFYVFFARQ